jgi:hypothetical protein
MQGCGDQIAERSPNYPNYTSYILAFSQKNSVQTLVKDMLRISSSSKVRE